MTIIGRITTRVTSLRRGQGRGEGENSGGMAATLIARTVRSLHSLGTAATAWPTRSPCSGGKAVAATGGTAGMARSSCSLGAVKDSASRRDSNYHSVVQEGGEAS